MSCPPELLPAYGYAPAGGDLQPPATTLEVDMNDCYVNLPVDLLDDGRFRLLKDNDTRLALIMVYVSNAEGRPMWTWPQARKYLGRLNFDCSKWKRVREDLLRFGFIDFDGTILK